MPGLIGFVIWIAGFFIKDCVLFLSKRTLITRYPVISNFRVRTGRVLGKSSGRSGTGIPSDPDHQYHGYKYEWGLQRKYYVRNEKQWFAVDLI